MEVEKLCSASIPSLEKMVCGLVVETAQESLSLLLFMAGFMFDNKNFCPEFAGIEKRFPLSDLNKVATTEPENMDASESDDDESSDSNGESDDDDSDDDFAESSDGEDDSDDGMPEANGNEESDDDSEDDDDDSDDDNDDENDDEEEDDEDEDEDE